MFLVTHNEKMFKILAIFSMQMKKKIFHEMRFNLGEIKLNIGKLGKVINLGF